MVRDRSSWDESEWLSCGVVSVSLGCDIYALDSGEGLSRLAYNNNNCREIDLSL